MAEMELQVYAKCGEITLNYEEIREWLQQQLETYNYEVTEKNAREAKADKARINKLAATIKKKRIEVEKQYCEPLDTFKEQMNELYNMARDSYSQINDQLNVFEDRRREAKHLEIEMYFAEKKFDLISLEQIYDPKWLNKGTSGSKWKREMDERIEAIKSDLNCIDEFKLTDSEREEVKGYYLDGLDLSDAMSQFKQQKARREALRKQREERTRAEEARKAEERRLAQERDAQAGRQKQQMEVQKSVPAAPSDQEEKASEVAEQPVERKTHRIVVEFTCSDAFVNEMNGLIRKWYPDDVVTRIIEREKIGG